MSETRKSIGRDAPSRQASCIAHGINFNLFLSTDMLMDHKLHFHQYLMEAYYLLCWRWKGVSGPEKMGSKLTFKVPSKIVADDILILFIIISSPGTLLQVSLCHGQLSVVCCSLLAFHIFDISRTKSWIELKLSGRHCANIEIQNC